MFLSNIKIRRFACSFLIFFALNPANAQTSSGDKYYCATVAFYNLENLFDTLNDVTIDDEEFLPESAKKWTSDKYLDKLEKLSTVLEKLGDEDGPEILGVSEVENRSVLEDLIKTEKLRSRGYGIAHIESPDRRGVDVALLYKKKYFTPITIKGVQVIDTADLEFKTRNLLVVTGVLSKDTITFIVNHWPSRRGGKDDKRILAAVTARKVVDSLLKSDPKARFALMGDFNDDPKDKSISEFLNAQPEKKLKDKNTLFNPMHSIHKNGYGTLLYDGSWNLFDQIILSQSLLPVTDNKYYYMKNSASIFYKKWLINQEGKNTGAPIRTWANTLYLGGYSDHLPVYLFLVQKAH